MRSGWRIGFTADQRKTPVLKNRMPQEIEDRNVAACGSAKKRLQALEAKSAKEGPALQRIFN